jgi:hypothetical protein
MEGGTDSCVMHKANQTIQKGRIKRLSDPVFTLLDRLSIFADRAGGWRIVGLILFAFLYYSSYGLSGLELRGEGGTIAVIAQRILEGERPLVDTFLGYNLFWFYPIVALFSITGPNFLVVRLFFLLLSTITGVLGYRAVWRVTGRPLLSLLAAVIIVLIPGMQFRTYMGLLAVGNLYLCLEVFALENSPRSRFFWLIGSGLFLGSTFLVRIDLGILYSTLTLGSLIVYPLVDFRNWKSRIRFSALSLASYAMLIILVHVPVDQFAARHGFRNQFWSQYFYWKDDVGNYLNAVYSDSAKAISRLNRPAETNPPVVSPAAPTARATGSQADIDSTSDRRTRPRPPISDIFLASTSGGRHLAFLIYYPLAGSAVMILLSILLLVRGWSTDDPTLDRRGFILLIATGSALALLPQYFLFRPDPPHISEMMCPFVIAAAIAYDTGSLARRIGTPAIGLVGTVYMILAAIHMAFYLEYGIKRPSMGSCAIRSRSEVFFKADNGVSAYIPTDKASGYQALYQMIVDHSTPKDYVVCFPYQPMVNFMTNRRSFLHNLYVDNASAPSDFKEQTIAEIEKYQPAAILIDDVAMNQIAASRFTVWAAPVYAYIKDHYEYAGTELGNEIYLRRTKSLSPAAAEPNACFMFTQSLAMLSGIPAISVAMTGKLLAGARCHFFIQQSSHYYREPKQS